MCKSGPTSLIAYGIAAVIAVHVIGRGKRFDKFAGYFILVYITVQLLEFFIWVERERQGLSKSADEAMELAETECGHPKNEGSSEFWTRLIYIALWAQPLAQMYLAYKYGRGYKKQLGILSVVYLILFIWAIVKATNPNTEWKSQPGTECSTKDHCAGGHLVWLRSDRDDFMGPGLLAGLYLFGLFFGLLFMEPKQYGWMLIVFGGVLALYSAKNFGKQEFSSMWCLYAVFWAFLVLAMSYATKVPGKA